MKCDELKAYKGDVTIPVYGTIADAEVYLKSEADKVIADLEESHKMEVEQLLMEIVELKDKLQNVSELLKETREWLIESQKMHQRCADNASKQIRRLKRALWIARAKRAIEKISWFKLWNASISTMNPEDGSIQEYDKWKKSLGKFLNKAEEYR